MRILLTGASGLLGSALTPLLTGAGRQVVPLERRGGAPGPGEAVWEPGAGTIDLGQAGPLDAVVHLAGETIGQRWSAAAKRRMRESRCLGTRTLSVALAGLAQPPRAFVCASATGYYGDRGEDWLEETSPPGRGFLAELTRDWEAAAAPAAERGIRVVQLRFGIVLSRRGGGLAKMLPAFRHGLGGRLGDGHQYWSWLTIGDAVRCVAHALECDALRGPVNAVSPHPVTNREFTSALGRVLGRPTFLAVPRFVLELMFGEMAREALLSSFRVRPARLLATGFAFAQPEVKEALREVLGRAGG